MKFVVEKKSGTGIGFFSGCISPSATRTMVGGRLVRIVLGTRTIEGKLRDIGNLQKISISS